MKRGLRIVRNVFIVLVIVAALAWVVNYRFKEKLQAFGRKTAQLEEITIPVAVSKAKTGTIIDYLALIGGVEAKSEVSIFSTVPGKVKSIQHTEGDRVKKQTVLAYVDRSEAGLTYALAPVESTIDGIVKQVFVKNGTSVNPAVPLFQIIDIDEVEVRTAIPEREVARVKEGTSADVSLIAYPGKTFSGKVTKLSPVLDPLSRTREARILIENPGHLLKPGMYGEVKLILNVKKNAVIIPSSAIIERNGKDLVFMVNSEKAVQVEPAFDIQEGDRISVISGVKPGDQVIVIGQQNLNEGDKVVVTEEME